MHDISREAVLEGNLKHQQGEDKILWTSDPNRIEPFFSPAMSVILISISFFTGGDKTSIGINLSLTACVLSGFPIIKNSIRAIFEDKRLNAELLVTLALIASVWVGEYMAGAIVVLMMNVGELLEDLTIAKTGDAIRKLIEITPNYATVIRGGIEIVIPVEDVLKGELILAKPGEQIPVDGIVEQGFAEVDESAITGEPLPVNKEENNNVFSGTINRNGVLIIRATKVGKQTTLARIIEMVKTAQSEKPPIERIADRFSGWFTPAILLFSIAVYLMTGEIIRAVSILVVACPCALVIATPTAVVAGIGNAARKGILIKGGAILESMGKATSFIFDKTGTVTLGKAIVSEIKSLSAFSDEAVLELASIAEKHSTHSLANAILSKAEENGMIIPSPDKSETIVGKGVRVISGKDKIVIGNPLMFKDEDIQLTDESTSYIEEKALEGNTVICVGFNGKLIGMISISDTIRKEITETINDLKSLGAERIIMLTGDRREAAIKISEGIGFDSIEAELLPEDKVSHISKIKESGEIVAMIGDGINDAPALALSDIGIAMGAGGTDIAIESADIVLVSDDVSKIPEAIAIGKKTITIIKQSLSISIIINAFALYFASTGLLGPIGGAIVHNIGSIIVIGNSARLISYSFRRTE